MKFSSAIILSSLGLVSAFSPSTVHSRTSTSLNIVVGEDDKAIGDRVRDVFTKGPQDNKDFDKTVLKHFPGAMSNKEIGRSITWYSLELISIDF
jgi:hypothetical protein